MRDVCTILANILPVTGGTHDCPRMLYALNRVAQAGGLAGTAVDLLFFPIDTVKTRLQSSQGFIRAGGFKGVYKGVGSVVVGSAPGGTFRVAWTCRAHAF